MVLSLLKIIVALYGATKLLGAKGASKEFFDALDFRANKFLISLKEEEVHNVLWASYRALFKFNIALIIIFIVMSFAIRPLPTPFVLNWGNVFFASFLFTMAVPWNLDHAQYAKKHFFSSPVVFVPAFPLLSLPLGVFYGIDFLEPLRAVAPFSLLDDAVGGNVWKFSLALSGIFFIIYMIIPYILFWLILLPTFYVLMLCIKCTQFILVIVHKHMNENILAVIMGVAAVVLAGL